MSRSEMDGKPAAAPKPIEMALRQARPQPVMSARAALPQGGEAAQVATLGRLLHAVWSVLERHNIIPMGPPFVRRDGGGLEAGFPVIATPPDDGEVRAGELPGGTLAVALVRGPYDRLPAARRALADWIAGQGLAPAGPGWECYLDDPTTAGADGARTELVVPLAGSGRVGLFGAADAVEGGAQ